MFVLFVDNGRIIVDLRIPLIYKCKKLKKNSHLYLFNQNEIQFKSNFQG